MTNPLSRSAGSAKYPGTAYTTYTLRDSVLRRKILGLQEKWDRFLSLPLLSMALLARYVQDSRLEHSFKPLSS